MVTAVFLNDFSEQKGVTNPPCFCLHAYNYLIQD